MHTVPVVSIDGVSASGKGTLGLLLSRNLHWHYLDSGIFYRLLAFTAVQRCISLTDQNQLATLALTIQPVFKLTDTTKPSVEIFFDGQNLTNILRLETWGMQASKLSIYPNVRAALLQPQRDLKTYPGLVADGRDMGSTVFPESTCKFFLVASPAVRAHRRYLQLKEQGIYVSFHEIKTAILKRDRNDQTRSVATLKATKDMYIINTTDLSVLQALELMRKKLSEVNIYFQQ